jgi:hypothetical protein
MNERAPTPPDWSPSLPTPSSTPERGMGSRGLGVATTMTPSRQGPAGPAVPLASAPYPAPPAPSVSPVLLPTACALPAQMTPPSPADVDMMEIAEPLGPEGARQPKRPLLMWPARPPTIRPRHAAGSAYNHFELNLALTTGLALREKLIALHARLDAMHQLCDVCPPRGSVGRVILRQRREILRQQRTLSHMILGVNAILEWRIQMVGRCMAWRQAHPDCPRRG